MRNTVRLSRFPGLFPPASGLAYLVDVAGLEWAISRVMRSNRKLRSAWPQSRTCRRRGSNYVFALREGMRYLSSKYPIREIWLENKSDTDPGEIQLAGEAAHFKSA